MMGIKVTLFGKFDIQRNDQPMEGMEAGRVKELLGFLLLHRKDPQPREALAEAIWEDQPPERSKKCLRQTLWKLKGALSGIPGPEHPALLIDMEWISLNPQADWWLDVEEFERTGNRLKDKRGGDLNTEEFLELEHAAELYRGELLRGWYQDWCVYERERLQLMYLMVLTKLIQYCEINRLIDAGLIYGEKLLRYDPAYERAHRQIMRLYYLAGDRTQALRQYARCVEALQNELGVEPSERTLRLYEQIKSDGSGLRLPSQVDLPPALVDPHLIKVVKKQSSAQEPS